MNRAPLSLTESDGYRLRQIHLPLNTIRLVIRLVCSRRNLHTLLDPSLFDCSKGDLMPKVDRRRQCRDCNDGLARCMLALQP
jgi:hypothetical protein